MLQYLTRPQIQKVLFALANPMEKCLIQLGLSTGCRVSEVVNIHIKNIRPGAIKIWDEKKDCYRMVVFNDTVDSAISEYLKTGWKAKPHVKRRLFYFSSRTANNIIKRVFNRAGVPLDMAHWHILRHTYVVQSLDIGVPINHIVAQTGDSPITLIRVYGVPSLETRQEMAHRQAYWQVSK